MSDTFYTNLRDMTAGPLLEKYGAPLIIKRITKGVADINSGSFGPDTVTEYAGFGLTEEYDTYTVSKSLIGSSDKKLLLSAKNLPIVPMVGDIIEMSDGSWTIPNTNDGARLRPIQAVSPAGIAVMYIIRIRQ